MIYKLKEILKIVNGATPKTSIKRYWRGNITWVTPKDLSNLHQRYIFSSKKNISLEGLNSCSTKLVEKGTIFLSSRAPIGYIAIAGEKACTNQGIKSLVCCKKTINNIFLYYLLLTKIDYLKSISSGSVFKELSKNVLENIEIDIPSLQEQQHIVNTILILLLKFL